MALRLAQRSAKLSPPRCSTVRNVIPGTKSGIAPDETYGNRERGRSAGRSDLGESTRGYQRRQALIA